MQLEQVHKPKLNNDYTNHNPVWFVYGECEPGALTGFIREHYADFHWPVNFGGWDTSLGGRRAVSSPRPAVRISGREDSHWNMYGLRWFRRFALLGQLGDSTEAQGGTSRRKRLPNSMTGSLPSSLVSRAVHRRGPVGSVTRRASLSATTALIVRPVRRARTESGTWPSSPSSAEVQGKPLSFRVRGMLGAQFGLVAVPACFVAVQFVTGVLFGHPAS